MIRPFVLSILFLASCGLHAQDGAYASGDDAAWQRAQMEAAQRHQERISRSIAATGRSRELAFAAHLQRMSINVLSALSPAGDAPSRPVPRDREIDGWIRAAAANAGDDVLANQMIAAMDEDATLRAEAVQRWQAVDRANLAPLLASRMPVEQMLSEARRMDRVDSRMYEGVRWMRSVHLAHPPTTAEKAAFASEDDYTPEEAAAIAGMATWLAIMTPAYPAMVEACRDRALRAGPTRAADCRHVANLLAEHSDSMMDRSIGLAMLRNLATSNAERSAIDARHRTMDWQLQQWGRVTTEQPRDGAEQFARLLRDDSIQGELQLMQRVLQEAGVPLEPPAGWTSPRR